MRANWLKSRFAQIVSAVFVLAALALLSPAARAEDKKPDDAKSSDKADKGDKADETAEQALKRITQLLMKDHDKDAYETEKAKFFEKFANDPARWQLKLFDSQTSIKPTMTPAEADAAFKKMKATWAEIVAAKDAPAELRERASLMSIQFEMRGASPEKSLQLVTDHIKQFPDSKNNGRLAMMLVASASQGGPEKSLPVLEKLAASDIKPIAEAAKEKIEQVKTLLELKTKPMELKFTTVDGKEYDLAEKRGKVVLIDFWATWCGPCVAGLPEVIDLYGKYHEKGLEIVGISFDQEKEKLTNFVEKKEMAWPQYFDGKGWSNEYGRKYGINAIPMMWLVGKDGKVIDFEARQDLGEKIEKLLKE